MPPIAAATLTFNSLNIIAQDNNYRPLSLRVSLRSVAQPDTMKLQFKTDSASILVKTILESLTDCRFPYQVRLYQKQDRCCGHSNTLPGRFKPC